MSALCVLGGAFALLVGLLNPNSPAILILLASLLAISIEAGNGAVYAVVPHVNPHINGLMGGITGASGNLGASSFAASGVARLLTIGVGQAALPSALSLATARSRRRCGSLALAGARRFARASDSR